MSTCTLSLPNFIRYLSVGVNIGTVKGEVFVFESERLGWQGPTLKSVPCPAKSQRVPSSTTTAATLPYAKLVGGFLGPMDPGVSTWSLPFLSKKNAQPHAVRSDSDPPAPVGRRQDSFGKAEREVAMKTIRAVLPSAG